jgi:uncharacterized lipoprotein YmbA
MKAAERRCWPSALVLAALLGACSSPSPTLYTIASVPGREQIGGPKVVVLQQIGLDRYLERSQIVQSSENYRLNVLSNDWWGEPLSAMLSRVLVTELSQRLPNSTVISETGAVAASPDATIALNVQRLDEDASGNLVMQAQAGITFRGRGTPALKSFRLTAAPPTNDTAGEVAAISAVVAQLADGLAAMVVTGPRGR